MDVILLQVGQKCFSSRVLERGNFLLLSLLHVTILALWSQCLFPRAEWTIVHSQISTFLVWSACTFSSASSFFNLQIQQTLAHNSGWMVVHPQISPVLEFLVPSRPNKTSFPISWVKESAGCSPTGLSVLDNRVFGFVWIRWVSKLLPATSESNSCIQLSLKETFGGGRGDTSTFSFWFLQSPSQQLPGDNKLGVFREGWWHYIMIEFSPFPLSKLYINPIHRVLVSFSTFSACTAQDVVWSSQACTDLWVSCPWEP